MRAPSQIIGIFTLNIILVSSSRIQAKPPASSFDFRENNGFEFLVYSQSQVSFSASSSGDNGNNSIQAMTTTATANPSSENGTTPASNRTILRTKPIRKIKLQLISNYESLESGNESSSSSTPICRQYQYLPQNLFALDSCAQCYNFVPNRPGLFGNPSKRWELAETEYVMKSGKRYTLSVLGSRTNTNLTVFANVSSPDLALLASFANEDARRKWVDCCWAAQRCCERIQINSAVEKSNEGKGTCESTWDGWQCWDETKAGTTAHEPCPHYIYFAMTQTPSCTDYAEKTCDGDGHWHKKFYKNSNSSKEWTNYGSCGLHAIHALKRRTYVHVMAYTFSIVAIIPALFIFLAYKQLRVDRIILHRNLFTSMMVNGMAVIAFKMIVIMSELQNDGRPDSIINQNGIGCRLLFILTKYSRLTNYMWMFCEGYYLHKLIAAAFAEQKSLIIFYLIGWVFPLVPTVVYAIFRMCDEELNDRCWVVPKESIEWIFNGPSLLSLLINMLFLINIIRVLVTKLRAAHANEPSQYRKAVRATLVLLPLFGLHFVVTIYRPASGTCEWLEIYYNINDVLDGLQGFLVALIFCYLNGEVVNLLKRTCGRWHEQNFVGGCPAVGRQHESNSRMRSRQSRGGSMLGRSVVSTQCYSSVPASPETCNATRLTIVTTPVNRNGGIEMNNLMVVTNTIPSQPNADGLKISTSPTSKNELTVANSLSPNHLNSVVKIRSPDDSSSWTEIKLNDGQRNGGREEGATSPTKTTITTNLDLKGQKGATVVSLPTKNGTKVEHQL